MGPRLISKLAIATISLLVTGLLTTPGKFQAPTTQPPVPQWQIDAGGKAQFDVASVKPDPRGEAAAHDNVGTGGLYSASTITRMFIVFAYKLNSYGYYSVTSQLPKWANETVYAVEARAPGNATKDQYRLMMQALLADRFKLAVHWELKQVPAIAVVLDKPGKLGPGIRPHTGDAPCPAVLTPSRPPRTLADGFPESCGDWYWLDSGLKHRVASDVALTTITDSLMGETPYNRPFLDKTGLKGNYDIALEWSPQLGDYGYQPDATGPSFVEALKNQLGLKLVKEIDPIETLIIDHIEKPTPN